jgi:hypothetical protein
VVVDAAVVELVGVPTFHPCCWRSWVKWPAVLGSWVPLATSTFTLAWAMVEVVVVGGATRVVVVVELEPDLK